MIASVTTASILNGFKIFISVRRDGWLQNSVVLVINCFNVGGARITEKLTYLFFGEEVVITFDADEESVVCCLAETFYVKQRIVQARETIEKQHAENRAKSRQQDSQLKSNGHECRQVDKRFTTDIHGVIVTHGPDHQRERPGKTDDGVQQYDPAQLGFFEAHGLLQPMHREGSKGVEFLESRLVNLLAGFAQIFGIAEFRENTV